MPEAGTLEIMSVCPAARVADVDACRILWAEFRRVIGGGLIQQACPALVLSLMG